MNGSREIAVGFILCALALTSAAAVATGPAAAQTDDASNATELDASFRYDVAEGCRLGNRNATTPLTLTANRAPYNVTVRAMELSGERLAGVFANDHGSDDSAITNIEQLNDTAIRMAVAGRNVTVPADFSSVGNGDYAFTFESAGGATATAEIFHPHIDCVDATFLRDGSSEIGRSDVATLPIWLDHADDIRVHVRNDDLSLTVSIEDDNNDGLVTLSLNTHLVGRNAHDDGHGRSYWTREGVSVRNSNDTITDVTIDDIPGGDDPLPAGKYDLVVDNGKSEYRLDTDSLSITDTAVADFESWMGPSTILANATAGDLRRAIANGTLADNESVANGSALVYEIDSSSLFGPLEAAATQYDGTDRYAQAFLDVATDRELSAVPGNPVRFGIPADSGARIALRDTYRNGGLVVARDSDNRTLYVGLRTDRLIVENGALTWSGQEFDANLTVHDEVDRQPVRFSDANASTAPQSTPTTGTPDQDGDRGMAPTTEEQSPETTTGVSTTDETPLPETTGPSTDATEDAPVAATTTTGDGAGFGVPTVLAALAAICSLVGVRFRS